MAGLVETMLVNNSKLSPLVKDEDGNVIGFSIENPNHTHLSVDLKDLTLGDFETHNSFEKALKLKVNNLIRQTIYDTYDLAAKAVPAFTPLSECLAKETSLIKHTNGDIEGFYFRFIPKEVKDNSQTGLVANIRGNPLLPSQEGYVKNKDGSTQHVINEQGIKYYMAKDGKWYPNDPLSLVVHEISHGCNDLMHWSKEKNKEFESFLSAKKVHVFETIAIDFVNRTINEPLGMPGRDPAAYYLTKPEGAPLGQYSPIGKKGMELLMQGEIPAELKHYSHPELNNSNGKVSQAENNTLAQLENAIHPKLLAALKKELTDLDSAYIYLRINEVVLNNQSLVTNGGSEPSLN